MGLIETYLITMNAKTGTAQAKLNYLLYITSQVVSVHLM